MRALSVLLLVLALNGCAQTKTNLPKCDHTVPSTKIDFLNYSIYVQNPDSLQSPTVWEGPVCIESVNYKQPCVFRESLVRSVKPIEGARQLSIDVFSGSESQQWVLDLQSCVSTERRL